MLMEWSCVWQDEHNDCEDTPCGEGAHMCFDLFNTWRCECTEGFQVSDNTCVAAVSPNVLDQRFEAVAHQRLAWRLLWGHRRISPRLL